MINPLSVAEESMAKVDQPAPKNDDSEDVADHTATIKSQILEKIGKPPRLDRVEVCRHHNGNYRVNVWEELEPLGEFSLSKRIHIGASYYLKVSDSGEIIHSNPPLVKRKHSS
ncbi:hypothetical protein [Rhodopirellula bahusiensis]|uniref:hypothetical protein n=1 Tax=Rhodopirellula bahusiensis TaxID=2014065 RepID=UPI001E5AB4B3|nr:hypothetical protein [Rhodopirellula bahusiensis]